MGLFDKFKAGLAKTHAKLAHEIKRIVTRSPKLTADSIEELETALIAADLGIAMTEQIISAVKKNYESQGGAGLDFLAIARGEIEKSLSTNKNGLVKAPSGPTIVIRCRRERHGQDDDHRQDGLPAAAGRQQRGACRRRHVPRGGHRATRRLGRADRLRNHQNKIGR